MTSRLLSVTTGALILFCMQTIIGCKSPPSKWQTEPSEGVHGASTIAWKTASLASGNIDIYLMVNNQPYLIEKAASSMSPMPRAAYRHNEIPRSAHSAVYFSGAEASDEDRQRMYVRDKGNQVIVYSGYLVPRPVDSEEADEENEMKTWTIKRTIRYSAPPEDEE